MERIDKPSEDNCSDVCELNCDNELISTLVQAMELFNSKETYRILVTGLENEDIRN